MYSVSMPCAMRGAQAATSPTGGAPVATRGLVADDAGGVVDLRARHDGGDRRRHCDGGRCSRGELRVAHQEHAADGLDALVDGGLHSRILRDVQPLRVDRDRAHEEEQRHGHAHENADDEHEAVEKLLIVLAQRRAPEPESGRDYSRRAPRIEARRRRHDHDAAITADRGSAIGVLRRRAASSRRRFARGPRSFVRPSAPAASCARSSASGPRRV